MKGKKTGGRVKGSVNKVHRAIKEVLQEAFDHLQTTPHANLKTWGENNPADFYRIAAKLIPQQTEVSGINGRAIEIAPNYNFDNLPTQELEQIESILSKAKK